MEEFQRSRKEQERERRRLRDRQRRRSMSLEERERHLARRRKNYQLRRQRAENTRLGSHGQTLARDGDFPEISSNHDLAMACDRNADSFFGSDRTESLSSGYTKSESLEVPAEKLANSAGRLCLIRLKRLARTLNSPCSNHCHQISETKGTGTSTCALRVGPRLIRVKRLARSSSSSAGANGRQGLDESKPTE